MDEFDFVVVGAGASGGPIVDRLTAGGRYSVICLEAGAEDSSRWLSVPFGFSRTPFDPAVTWQHSTEPEPGLNGRRVGLPTGKVLGGGTSINGMVYVRGQPSDFDSWRRMGNEGWSFDDCLPYFKRLERCAGHAAGLQGDSGPVALSQGEYRNELGESFLAACAEVGVPLTNDFNGYHQDGAGYYHGTVSGGRRVSTATAYLRGARRRSNCRVETNALVEKVLVEEGRATGVAWRRGQTRHTVRARRDVILCAGAIGSPRLLQLSGIGPAPVLQAAGVPVLHELSGVGENLQDHWTLRSAYRTWWRLSVNDDLNFLHRRISAVLEYMALKTGPLTASPAFTGAFVRLRGTSEDADTQLYFCPWSADRLDKRPDDFSGFSIFANLLRLESRGHVRIGSPDAAALPSVRGNYLTAEEDRRACTVAIKFVRLLARTSALGRIITEELAPGVEFWSDDDFVEYARREGQSGYNPAGTCRMGRDDMAVVDPQLRVHGIAGLRIADASIMPTLVSGNAAAACMMIGEKAADLILADAQ